MYKYIKILNSLLRCSNVHIKGYFIKLYSDSHKSCYSDSHSDKDYMFFSKVSY